MKILYVSLGTVGSTNFGRINGLRAAGATVDHFICDYWTRHPLRIIRGLHNRMGTGPLFWDLNRRIRNHIQQIKPDILWIDKGTRVTANTIQFARDEGLLTVHYTPDPAIQFHSTAIFLNALPLYDLVFTTKSWEIPDYIKRGVKQIVFSPQGADESSCRPLTLSNSEKETYGCDVVFAGHAEKHYIETVLGLLEHYPQIDLKIWGAWKKAVNDHPKLRPYWQGRGAHGDEYAKALSGAKIGLGFLSKYIPETETTRTFEIPACRTTLLAERTASHLSLFEEGKEAEFYSDIKEAVAKIKALLADPKKLDLMAERGYQRFLNSNYSVRHAMRACVDKIHEIRSPKS